MKVTFPITECICAIVVVAVMFIAIYAVDYIHVIGDNKTVITTTTSTYDTMETLSHDGHLWIITRASSYGGINTTHHPDCQCQKTFLPENPNNANN